MRIFLITILLSFINFVQCGDEIKLHLISDLDKDGFEIIKQWSDPIPFIYLGVDLKINNAKVIIIQDLNRKNKICKLSNIGDQLFYLRSDKAIKERKLMIRVNNPCVAKPFDNANLRLTVITIDKKKYHDNLSFKNLGYKLLAN